jgi:hypothetical protein
MASLVNAFIEKVSAWPNFTIHPHQFLAHGFPIGKAEIGHVHSWSVVDILFTRVIRIYLVETDSRSSIIGCRSQDGRRFICVVRAT